MQNKFTKKRRLTDGFTLIELLVVVSIISLLASITMASLTSARGKAKDAAIKESAIQLANLMALNYSDYGGYSELQPATAQGLTSAASCDTYLPGGSINDKYKLKAKEICKYMFNNATGWGGTSFRMIVGVNNNPTSNFSWEIFLNNQKWYCVGSSGKGESPSFGGGLGCYDNP